MTQNANVSMKDVQKESTLNLQNRKLLTLTGVQKVISINENQAKIELFGSTFFAFGSEMKLNKLNLEEGEVIIEGAFDCFKYGNQKEKAGFFKRLFK